MNTQKPNGRKAIISFGYGFAVTGIAILVGMAFFWNYLDEHQQRDQETAMVQPIMLPDGTPISPEVKAMSIPHSMRKGGMSIPDVRFYSMMSGEENGIKVIKFKLSENGDEITLDANTGKLVEKKTMPIMNVDSSKAVHESVVPKI